MAERTTQHGHEVLTIASADGSTRASFVPEKGGMGSSIVMPGRDGPRELLFLHDFFWDRQTDKIPGGWPFLFPNCGRLERGGEAGTYLYDGHLYRLPSHGFGPRAAWEVAAEAQDSLTLRLVDTEATRAVYPFEFEILLKYRVAKCVLVCEQTYTNRGQVAMPYYAGFHPYLRTPAPGAGKERVMLDFAPARAFAYNERLTDLARETAVPQVPAPIVHPTVNERIARVASNKEARLILPDGLTVHLAAVGVEDDDLFPYVQLYTMPDKPFFCIEPWMAFPNALNTVAGARWLRPGQSEHGILRLWVTW